MATACTNSGGVKSVLFGTQCLCTTRRTTYPVGTDLMIMAFEHRFSTSADQMDGLEGSSAHGDDALTTTTIDFSNGSSVVFQPGSVVRLTIADWLKAADSTLGLDTRNTAVTADMNINSCDALPRTRLTTPLCAATP